MPIGAAAASETESLLKDDDKSREESWDKSLPRRMWAVSSVVCTLFLIATIVTAAVLMHRVNNTINSIDNAVGFHSKATNALRNIDTLLNRSAAISETVHRLGIKGLDASMFSQPYLVRMLNSTTSLVEDVHRVAENPHIQLGGR
jgi:predicted PurR-regulated permease PerM